MLALTRRWLPLALACCVALTALAYLRMPARTAVAMLQQRIDVERVGGLEDLVLGIYGHEALCGEV